MRSSFPVPPPVPSPSSASEAERAAARAPSGRAPEPANAGLAPRADRRVALAVATVAFAVALLLGRASIDFGHHWDEDLFVEQVAATIESGRPLPGRYAYPSVTYWVALAAVLPTAATHGFERAAIVDALREVRPRSDSLPFLLHARLLAFALAHLMLFWVARLALELARSRFAALVATLFCALSFEVHYHARWLAPDALVAAFATGAVLGALLHLRTASTRSLVLATLAAALAAGSKYPGALALAPILGAVWLGQEPSVGARARRSLVVLALFAAGFVATTPGALLETDAFLSWIEKELLHYARGHHVYSIAPGIEHASRLGVYFATQVLHAYDPLALALFALACLGVLEALARDRRAGFLVFSLPWLWVLYFAQQRVMIVRNVLVVAPFLAVFAGVGLAAVARRNALVARTLAAVLIGVQAVWLVAADRSVAQRAARSGSELGEAQRADVARFAAQSDLRVHVATPDLRPAERAGAQTDGEGGSRTDAGERVGHFVATPEEAERVVFDSERARPHRLWNAIANRPGTYAIVGGPFDVNWDYYPTWVGRSRPLAVDAAYFVDVFGR